MTDDDSTVLADEVLANEVLANEVLANEVLANEVLANEVLAAEDLRYEALLGPDLPTLERLFHDRLSYAHSSGVRDTKAEYLAKIESGYYDYSRLDHPVERVDVVGDTVVVVGRMTADLTVEGTPKTIDNLALAVWTRDTGEWQLVGYASTPLPKA